MKAFKFTVRDEFLKKEFSGVFSGETLEEAEEVAREFYADELDTFPEDVEIVNVQKVVILD